MKGFFLLFFPFSFFLFLSSTHIFRPFTIISPWFSSFFFSCFPLLWNNPLTLLLFVLEQKSFIFSWLVTTVRVAVETFQIYGESVLKFHNIRQNRKMHMTHSSICLYRLFKCWSNYCYILYMQSVVCIEMTKCIYIK